MKIAGLSIVVLFAFALAAGGASLSLSPADCPAGFTPAQTEGPYFKAGSPERSSLADAGTPGTHITLTGWVILSSSGRCTPVPGAVLDFWQADDTGRYDNTGYSLRGHVTADPQGRYVIQTIIPGIYPGRTRHIHVKVSVPGKPVLTTQLYFPEDAQANARDGIYDARLLVAWLDPGARTTARFDFVLN
jgi:protocatechuate 3,4-dioxygenase beta subunit